MEAAVSRGARTVTVAAGGAWAVARALGVVAPPPALAARVDALAAGSMECVVCMADRRSFMVFPCCAAFVCVACTARHASSRADAACVHCRAPLAAAVRAVAPGGEPMEEALAALEDAPHASLAHAVAAATSALVCDGGCRRVAVVGRVAADAEWVARLRDLLAAPPACCEVLAATDAGGRAAWAATVDPSPAALAVGATGTADVVGVDLAGADALVTVGRSGRLDELWRRTLRLVPPGARKPHTVFHVSIKQTPATHARR